MTAFAIVCIVTTIAAFLAALFIIRNNPTRLVNQICSILNINIGLWTLGLGLLTIQLSREPAIFWLRIHYIGAVLIPVLFLHFIIALLNIKASRVLMSILYAISIFFLFSSFAGILCDVRPILSFNYYTSPGPLYIPYTIFFVMLVTYSYWLIVKSYKSLNSLTKNQINYVVIASIINYFCGGLMAFLPVFDIRIYPYGMFVVPLYSVMLAYVIVRHRLMDIEIVIKKGMVYSLVTAISTGLLVSAILIGEYFFKGLAGYSSLFISIPSVFLLAFIFQPLRNKIQDIVDKTFFVGRYDYQRILKRYSSALTRPATDLNRFSKLSTYLMVKSLKLSGATMLVLNRQQKRYEVRAAEKDAGDLERTTISDNYFIVKEMNKSKKIISREEIEYILSTKNISDEEARVFSGIKDEMEKLKAVIAMPSVSESEYFKKPTLLSMICLGEKLSGEAFSSEDISFLETMANQAAITVEYAFIMEELKQNQNKLIQSEKLAALGTMAAGVVKELNKPLEAMEANAREMTDKFSDPEFRQKFFTEIPTEIMRLDKIVNDLLLFARVGKLNLQSVELNHVVEKVIGLLNISILKNNIELKKDFQQVPALNIDPEKFTSALTNLLSVSIKAMPAGGKLALKSYVKGNNAVLEVSDTGPEIPKERMGDIFVSFFTRKEGQGGLELALVNKIVRDHGGTIRVDSSSGAGATFLIQIPFSPHPAAMS